MKKNGKKIAATGLVLALTVSNLAIHPADVQAAAKKATAIKLNAATKTLYVGDTFTLKVKKVTPAKASSAVTWKSSNKKIATVTAAGKVTAKKKGTAKITATSKSNKKVKAVCKITVTKKAVLKSGSYENVKWKIYQDGMLEVTGSGDMYAKNEKPQWTNYPKKIKSAKIEVTGATHLDNLFLGCSQMADVDLSKLDTSKATDMSNMFNGCWRLQKLDVSKFDTSKVTNMSGMFEGCGLREDQDEDGGIGELDVSGFDTSKVKDMSNMFKECNQLKELNMSNFDTSKVTDMSNMFKGCTSLTNIDVSKFDTSKVTNMSGMFAECGKLSEINLNNFNTAEVTNMKNMFAECSNLANIDISSFDISKVIDMTGLFEESGKLMTIHTPKKSAGTVAKLGKWYKDADEKFYKTLPANVTGSSILTAIPETEKPEDSLPVPVIEGDIIYSGSYGTTTWTIDKNGMLEIKGTGDMYSLNGEPQWRKYCGEIESATIEVTGATHLDNLFQYCTNLKNVDLSRLDTSEVMDMSRMFADCSNLTSVDISKFDTSKVVDMKEMFLGCFKLTTIDVSSFDTSNVVDMAYMFYACSGITAINLSSFDTSNVIDMTFMLRDCSSLTTIHTPGKSAKVVTELPTGTWKGSGESTYTVLPANAAESIILERS